eukprot:scaffold2973_cov67-Cylindrotheca_fusiformis.AAC.2
MALSTGGLAAIILFLLLLHAGAMVGYYFLLQKNPSAAEKFALDERFHDNARWTLVGLISVSWIFSVAATASCTFLTVQAHLVEDLHVGFNSYEDGGCITFNRLISSNSAAFTFAVFNCLLTTAGVAGIFLMQFVLTKGRKRTWMALRIVMYASMWCCLFSFYIIQGKLCDMYDCSLGTAGVTQVFNVLFLIVIAVLLFLIPFGEDNFLNTNRQNQALEEEDRNLNEGENKKFETETHLPDGSIRRDVETTNPDGSITVTTTIEKAPSEQNDEDGFVMTSDDDSIEEPSVVDNNDDDSSNPTERI